LVLHSKRAIDHPLADKERRGVPCQLAIDKAAVRIEARSVSIARKVQTQARQFILLIFPEQIMPTHAGTAALSAARRFSRRARRRSTGHDRTKTRIKK